MATESSRYISLEEEIEGDLQGSPDLVFCRIGNPVSLKPTGSVFDLSNPPSQPLAVSERHGLLFLAHSDGFFVANTKDVIGIAKEAKDKGSGQCIQNSSIVDVQIGRVSILWPFLGTLRCFQPLLMEKSTCFMCEPSWTRVFEPPDFPKMTSPYGDIVVTQKLNTSTPTENVVGGTTSRLKDELDTAVSGKKQFSLSKPAIGTGGFKDRCTIIQENSLLALEAGLYNLSVTAHVYRNKVEDQLMEIQQFHIKMLQGKLNHCIAYTVL